MAKIIKVELENFQSHKHSVIEFDKGLTVITGPSDSGKSAIIRAIKWVLYNEPRGSDFISTGTNQCRVSLYFDNDIKITRERASNKNRYILEKDGEKQIFEGFGNNVPQEIINSHQIRNLYLDTDQKTSINLANQLEGPFLLSESGAIKAKAIGRILGIHYLDSAARKASSTINDYKKEYTQKLDEQKAVQQRQQEYKIYDSYAVRLEKATTNYAKLEQLNNKFLTLTKLTEKVLTVNNDKLKSQKVIDDTEHINEIENRVKKVAELAHKKQKIMVLHLESNKIIKEILKTEKLISSTHNYLEIDSNLRQLDYLNLRLKEYKTLWQQSLSKKRQIDNYQRLMNKTEELPLWENKFIKLEELNVNVRALKRSQEILSKLNKEINSVKLLLESTNKYQELLSKINQLTQKADKLDKLANIREQKKELEARVRKGRDFLSENNQNLNKSLRLYQEKLAKIDECPICETRIDKQRAEALLKKWKVE